MAKEKTKFHEFHEYWAESRGSIDILQTLQQGGHRQDLPDIAANEAHIAGLKKAQDALSKGEEEYLAARKLLDVEEEQLRGNPGKGIRPCTDPYVLFPWLEARAKRTHKEFEKFGKDNLESILNSTPDNILDMILFNYTDPRSNKSKQYEDVVKLHKDYNEMSNHLKEFKDKNTPDEKRNSIHEKMADKLFKYYKDVYKSKEDEPVLKALHALVKFNPQVAAERYKAFTGWKLEDLNKKLDTKDKKVAYVRSSAPKDHPLQSYESFFEEQYQAQKHQQAA